MVLSVALCVALSRNFFETMVDVVVVFSNERPEIGQLSKDRWKIFQIRDEELLDATERYV